jgi:hypothetical protein
MLEKRKGIPSLKGYYTAKSGEIFHYDSMTELAMMMYFDKMVGNNSKWCKNTKLRIPYTFEGKDRKYIPDFIVYTLYGGEYIPFMIYEIKGSNDKPELPFKCIAAEVYCNKNDIEFVLLPYAKVREMVDWNKVREYHYEYKK